MAIVLTVGNYTKIYKIAKKGQDYQYTCVGFLEAAADQLGDFSAGISVLNEIEDKVEDYDSEKYYCVLTNGSGVMYKTINVPMGSLDIDPALAKSKEEYEQALSLLKNKYILDGYNSENYELMILDHSELGANVYMTLAFAPKKLVTNICELCSKKSLDLLEIVPDIKMLKEIIHCSAKEYFISQKQCMTLINDFGMIVLNGQYPMDLAKSFLVNESKSIFETEYAPGPVISYNNIGEYVLVNIVPGEDNGNIEYDDQLEIVAAVNTAYEKEISKAYTQKEQSMGKEEQVRADGFMGRIKQFFTKK